MGLTISYSLLLNSATGEEVREKLLELRRFASDLPLEKLGELVDMEGDACHLLDPDPNTSVKFGAMAIEDYEVIHKGIDKNVPSCSHLVGFEVFAGGGCSTCTFGLATHASNPGHWQWQDYCKTQYASNPGYGGLENFLRCHQAVIHILDACQRLGILESASDPSGYWEERNLETLVKSLREHNIFTAAAVGNVKDLLEPLGYTSQAAILNRPDFEHLEALGRIPSSSPPPATPMDDSEPA